MVLKTSAQYNNRITNAQKESARSGGKPPFLTCDVIKAKSLARGDQFSRFERLRDSFNSNKLTGKEGWLAPLLAHALAESSS